MTKFSIVDIRIKKKHFLTALTAIFQTKSDPAIFFLKSKSGFLEWSNQTLVICTSTLKSREGQGLVLGL